MRTSFYTDNYSGLLSLWKDFFMDFKDFFDASSEQAWKDKITADLKGGSIADLTWQSEVGPVDPVLFDYQPKYARFQTNANHVDNSWLIAQTFNCQEASVANKNILDALTGGVNCIKLINVTPKDLEIILKNVMIEIIETLIYAESHEVESLNNTLQSLLLQRNLKSENVNFYILEDPIGCYFSGHVEQVDNITSKAIVRSAVFENAGASVQHEIGYTLAEAHEYLLQLIKKGVDKKEAAHQIQFEISVGNSYFMQIAKINALKSLWSTILSGYDIQLDNFKIHAVTSSFYQSKADVHNNLLRATTAAMASVIAGINSLEILPYDAQLDEKQSDGYRLAKNISLLLQEESYLNQVKDIASGAYYIEQLTDIIIENAWNTFQNLEAHEGILACFESGSVQQQIQKDLALKIEQFKTQELVLIGVNKQPNGQDKFSEQYSTPTQSKFLKPYRLAQTEL